MHGLIRCLSLSVVLSQFGSVGCVTSVAANRTPEIGTVGDFFPEYENRVNAEGISCVMPEGWNLVVRDGVVTLVSQPVRGAEVRLIPVDGAEISSGSGPRPEHCPDHYARCTPIEPGLVTHYGVVWWRQTVWMDNGDGSAIRLEARWNNGIVGRGIPSILGCIARSARVER